MRIEMPEKRKKYDREFREGAVRIVEETGKPIAQVACDLGVVEGTLGNWVKQDRELRDGSSSLSKDDYAELQDGTMPPFELAAEGGVLTKVPTINFAAEQVLERADPQRTLRANLAFRPTTTF